MIPTSTRAAAVDRVLPDVNGQLDGSSMRGPAPSVSVVELTFSAARKTSKEEIDAIMLEASEGRLKGVLAVNSEPRVSWAFNDNPASSIYEAPLTKVMEGTMVKVLSWYDNEWGFSNRMRDTTVAFMAA